MKPKVFETIRDVRFDFASLFAALTVGLVAVSGCQSAFDETPDKDQQSGELQAGDEESDDEVTCPDPADSGDEVCAQVVTSCEHESSGKTCEYATPCEVPGDLETSSDWSCGTEDSSEPSESQCLPAAEPPEDQACPQVVSACENAETGETCQYATPCHVPESYENDDDWSCGTGSPDDGSDDSDDSDDGSDAPVCPDSADSGDQVCTQVVTACEHEPSGKSCEYATPCDVPDELESSDDWTCGSESSGETSCPAPAEPEEGQACVDAIAQCEHDSGEVCEYATPCHVPDELDQDDAWSCSL